MSKELGELASIAGNLASTLLQESAHVYSVVLYRQNAQLPVVALPPEILADIFVYACSRPHNEDDYPYHYTHLEPPISHIVRRVRHAIGATCRRWREVLLSTTLLWSSISIEVALQGHKIRDFYGPPSSDEKYEFTPSLEMLEVELARAGTRPLRLGLYVQYQLEMPLELYELIRDAFPRCVTIYLDFPPLTPFAMPLEETSVELPLLQSLGIHLLAQDHTERRRRAYTQLSLAPALRDFSTSYSVVPPPLCTELRFTRLHLHDEVPFSEAVAIIRLSPQLRQLQWEVPRLDERIPQEPIHLPLLDELWFIHSGGDASAVLSLIFAPQLSTLQLWGGYVLPKRFPLVRRLIFSTRTLGDWSSFVEALSCFPIVEELDINYSMLSEPVVEALSQRGPNNEWTVLPRLRRLVWPASMAHLNLVEGLLRTRNEEQQDNRPPVTLVLDYDEDDPVPPSVANLSPWATVGINASGSNWPHRPFESADRW